LSNPHGHHWIRDAKRQAIYARDGHRCVYCGAGDHGSRLTLDHLHPRALGGTNDASNLVTACLSCNSQRQSVVIRGWFRILRARGIDTDKIGARIKRLTRRPLR
jgi:5-methylcytosine-specific restriction endonuclease McrA